MNIEIEKNGSTKPVLLYITDGYPFKYSEVFPGDELPFLAECNWDIYLLPILKKNNEASIVPPSVTVNTCLVASKKQKLLFLFSFQAIKLLLQEYKSYKGKPAKVRLKAALGAIATALCAKNNLRKFINKHSLFKRPLVVYTYWYNSTAFGVNLLQQEFPHIRFVSRVHGYDLYPERHKHGYLPFRFLRCKRFDAVCPVSKAGFDLLSKDGHSPEHLHLNYLGVPATNAMAQATEAGCLAVVSCASVVPVKRLCLLLQSLAAYAIENPNLSICWQHFGGGQGLNDLRSFVKQKTSALSNLRVVLYGHKPVAEVREFLASNKLDVFISVSESEGLPVSMQEAAICGIPIIATDAGGTGEIVTKETGILLSLHYTQQNFSEALTSIQEWKNNECREKIADLCKQKFLNTQNYKKFIQEVLEKQINESKESLSHNNSNF